KICIYKLIIFCFNQLINICPTRSTDVLQYVSQNMYLMSVYFSFCFLLLFSICVSSSLADDATVLSEEDSSLLPTVTNEHDVYKGSPAVSVLVAFSKPAYGLYSARREMNFPAGEVSSLVASLANTNPPDKEQFRLDFIEGALHYPSYYDYRMQNFTRQRLQGTLEPGQEISLYYRFKPSPELAGRSFDLSIVVYYHDNNNIYYSHKLFNQTVNLFETEEGVDTELIFLVILVIALSIAILIGIWHWFTSIAHKRQPTKKSSKVMEDDGDSVVENEYLALINSKPEIKKGKISFQIHFSHNI
ncbi:Translocon-associated protein subunit alpha, partial [Schistosoma japonicum]